MVIKNTTARIENIEQHLEPEKGIKRRMKRRMKSRMKRRLKRRMKRRMKRRVKISGCILSFNR